MQNILDWQRKYANFRKSSLVRNQTHDCLAHCEGIDYVFTVLVWNSSKGYGWILSLHLEVIKFWSRVGFTAAPMVCFLSFIEKCPIAWFVMSLEKRQSALAPSIHRATADNDTWTPASLSHDACHVHMYRQYKVCESRRGCDALVEVYALCVHLSLFTYVYVEKSFGPACTFHIGQETWVWCTAVSFLGCKNLIVCWMGHQDWHCRLPSVPI